MGELRQSNNVGLLTFTYEKVSEGCDDDADGQADRDEDGHEGSERSRPAFRSARRCKSR